MGRPRPFTFAFAPTIGAELFMRALSRSAAASSLGFRWTDYDMIDPRLQDSLETDGADEPPMHRYLLCSSYLYGLALKSRQWSESIRNSYRGPFLL